MTRLNTSPATTKGGGVITGANCLPVLISPCHITCKFLNLCSFYFSELILHSFVLAPSYILKLHLLLPISPVNSSTCVYFTFSDLRLHSFVLAPYILKLHLLLPISPVNSPTCVHFTFSDLLLYSFAVAPYILKLHLLLSV